jgi:hypothetical protein
MKTTILITNLDSWGPFKDERGVERSGVSAVYLFEDFEQSRTTLKDQLLTQVQSAKLPALFDADLKPVQRYNGGKASLKYEISSLKFVKEVNLFNKA